ncbi:unnamed protein product [Amoebophrya sp. A25]|nr:unnamed protein product [Amoebophrya sp. A25]|eukprot:GSA25T00013878001.1
MSWTRFKYHEGHAMPAARRDTGTWLFGVNKIDKAPTATSEFLPQKSTLKTGPSAGPGSIPRANIGSRTKLRNSIAEDTPGPGSYETVSSSLKTASAITIKGGPKRAPVRETTTAWPQKLREDAEARPGYYEKLSNFGEKKSRGGVIGKASRKTGWLNKSDPGSGAPQFYAPGSTLLRKAVPHLGSRSPRFATAPMEQTPGPAAYTPRIPHADTRHSKGVKIPHSGRTNARVSAPASMSRHLAVPEDTPGPGAYAPEAPYDHRRKRAIQRAGELNRSVMSSRSHMSTSRMSVPMSSRGPSKGPGSSVSSSVGGSAGGYQFQPRSRSSSGVGVTRVVEASGAPAAQGASEVSSVAPQVDLVGNNVGVVMQTRTSTGVGPRVIAVNSASHTTRTSQSGDELNFAAAAAQ